MFFKPSLVNVMWRKRKTEQRNRELNIYYTVIYLKNKSNTGNLKPTWSNQIDMITVLGSL